MVAGGKLSAGEGVLSGVGKRYYVCSVILKHTHLCLFFLYTCEIFLLKLRPFWLVYGRRLIQICVETPLILALDSSGFS
jgi:hypothetical protein